MKTTRSSKNLFEEPPLHYRDRPRPRKRFWNALSDGQPDEDWELEEIEGPRFVPIHSRSERSRDRRPGVFRTLALMGPILMVALSTSAGEGYLRSIGPVPLRWLTPSLSHAEAVKRLPVLVMEDKSATAASAQSGATNPSKADAASHSSVLDESLATMMMMEEGQGQRPGAPGTRVPEWLEALFYTPGGTNRVTGFMPIRFVPPGSIGAPAPPAQHSSTATYTQKP